MSKKVNDLIWLSMSDLLEIPRRDRDAEDET